MTDFLKNIPTRKTIALVSTVLLGGAFAVAVWRGDKELIATFAPVFTMSISYYFGKATKDEDPNKTE